MQLLQKDLWPNKRFKIRGVHHPRIVGNSNEYFLGFSVLRFVAVLDPNPSKVSKISPHYVENDFLGTVRFFVGAAGDGVAPAVTC